MNRYRNLWVLAPVYCVVLCGLLLSVIYGSRAIIVTTENFPLKNRRTVVIDAGHGGVDGGATSCTGVLESTINLEIALKLDDLLHLLGINTSMIRTTDTSVHTNGNSIAQKKVSDLKERVRIVNGTEDAILISIHQNTFSDSQYSGAQVFYAPNNESKLLGEQLQIELVASLNPGSNRKSKIAESIYLMQHINCPGVLIECGFLSNPAEEAQLRSNEYQNKLCCVVASLLSRYLAS